MICTPANALITPFAPQLMKSYMLGISVSPIKPKLLSVQPK